uniref:Uncharacterized protein n=1 Tax=Brassica campestris TaxID=3711 RepID=A0A3P5ZGI7_BRACM|nr:unnamed protein product [Brassica rapa]
MMMIFWGWILWKWRMVTHHVMWFLRWLHEIPLISPRV